MTRAKMRAIVSAMMVVAVLMVVGCGNANKQGAEAPLVSPASSPGNIQASITSAVISVGTGSLVVTFTLRDEQGAPLSPTDPGINGFSFVVSQLGPDGEYHNPIRNASNQPAADSGGVFAGTGGSYTYTFGRNITTLPGYDPTLTYTVSAYIGRTIGNAVGSPFRQTANPRLDFRPNGTPVTDHRQIVSIDACNECHGRLTAHEGNRKDVALCILCHNPGEIDTNTGNTIEFKAMIHKIHMGQKLPSNKAGGAYGIIGFGGSLHNFGTILYPQMSGDTQTNNAPVECVKCHRAGTDTNGQPYGLDVNNWKTTPEIDACTTCHDTTVFDSTITSLTFTRYDGTVVTITTPTVLFHTGGDNGGVPFTDADCGTCHTSAVNGNYSTASVPDVHTIPIKSTLNPGILFSITSVTGIASGMTPTVTFTIKDKAGANLPMVLGDRTDIIMAYMTGPDYDNTLSNWLFGQAVVQGKSANAFSTTVTTTANGDGSYSVSYVAPWYVPSATKLRPVLPPAGVVTFAVYGGKVVTITTPHRVASGTTKVTLTSTSVAINSYDISTGLPATAVQQRRKVVATTQCNGCHLQLAFHGRRTETQLCVMCHAPNLTYLAPSTNPTPSYSGDLKDFVHGIHGATTSTMVFRQVERAEYPNDPRKCAVCHIDSTYLLPLPAGVKGSLINGTTGTSLDGPRVPPMTAACVACHEGPAVAAHTGSKVVNGQETCNECHSTGLLMGVDFVHLPAD